MTNVEAKYLIEIEKRLRKSLLQFPEAGTSAYYKADDLTKIKNFTIQVYAGAKRRTKCSYTLLYRKTMLLRLDTDGSGAHYNNDGSIIPPHTPHVHLYDELSNGHNAIRIPEIFSNIDDIYSTLRDFFAYINIINLSNVKIIEQGGLLS